MLFLGKRRAEDMESSSILVGEGECGRRCFKGSGKGFEDECRVGGAQIRLVM